MKRVFSCFLLFLLLCACASTAMDERTPASASAQAVSSAPLTVAADNISVRPKQAVSAIKLDANNPKAAENADSPSINPSAPANQTAWWKEAFELNDGIKETIQSAQLYRYSDQVSVQVLSSLGPDRPDGSFRDYSYLDALAPSESDEIGSPLSDLSMLEIVLDSDIKYTYRFYERGVVVSKLPPGKGGEAVPAQYGENKRLAVNLKAYQTLLSSLRTRMERGLWDSSWLRVMRQTNAERVVVTSSDRKQTTEYNRECVDQFSQVFSIVQRLGVEPKTCRRVLPNSKLNKAAHIQIDFYNGIRYDIWHNGQTLLVVSSDMDYAIQYKADADSAFEELNNMARGHFPVLTGKPVIYLYPQKPTDVSVKVHYKGEFTYTYPTYHDGWNVTAYPDGRLVNQSDGSEHHYLFWEGGMVIDWNFDEGFVVKGSEVEPFLIEKLSYMGLTPREYNDFIVYWVPKLQQNAYNLITFSTSQYEALAPLEVSPTPDSVLRVHMVYKELGQPISIRPQTLKPFERKGFTVVEWGGTRA